MRPCTHPTYFSTLLQSPLALPLPFNVCFLLKPSCSKAGEMAGVENIQLSSPDPHAPSHKLSWRPHTCTCTQHTHTETEVERQRGRERQNGEDKYDLKNENNQGLHFYFNTFIYLEESSISMQNLSYFMLSKSSDSPQDRYTLSDIFPVLLKKIRSCFLHHQMRMGSWGSSYHLLI